MNTTKLLLAAFFILTATLSQAQKNPKEKKYNPFESIGKKGEIVTAYGDRFVEVFDTDSIQRIGSVMFHIYQKKVVGLLDADSIFNNASDNSSASRWLSVDPLAFLYFSYSPYNFVLNNPIKNVDPDGRLVIGATKDDAAKFHSDLNAMLKDDKYEQFRGLISVKGKTFNTIDQAAFDKAIEGLSEDQIAFAKTVLNTINSADKHMVEYVSTNGDVSKTASKLLDNKAGGVFGPTMANNDGKLSGATVAGIWGSVTTNTKDGSYSVIIEGLTPEQAGLDYLNSSTNTKGGNPAGRPSTAGHEVLGHRRFRVTSGEDAAGHHVNAIRMENLILRIMGHGDVQRTGEKHGLMTPVANPSELPKQ